jgi:RNA polymerase sigma factor (sigma-70 family)
MTEEATIEKVLARAVRDGDLSAWKVLYDRHFADVLRAAERRIPRDRAAAEDVVQEAWMIAVRKIDSFDAERGRFLAWMIGIVDKVAANAVRRRENLPAPIGEAAGEIPAPRVDSFPRRTALESAMRDLPDRYRRVLWAKYDERLSVAEIAHRERETEKTIESLLSRARAALRKLIDEAKVKERAFDGR